MTEVANEAKLGKVKKRKKSNCVSMSKGERVFQYFDVALLIILALIMVYPVWYIICASFSDVGELQRFDGLLFLPIKANVNAYKLMIQHPLIVRSYLNTLIILVATLAVNMLFTTMCAYILSRKNVFWNKLFAAMVLFTMFFSGGLIPGYLLVAKTLNLNNSFWALILPNAINVYNMIILRTSFAGIPNEIEESVKIDGGGHWTFMLKMVVPLSKAALAVIALYYAVGIWNSWFEASIFIKSRDKYPLQLILREILIENDTSSLANSSAKDQAAVGETIKYATIVFATVPILCIYPFLQKYFVKGVMIGAVKG